MSNVVERRSPNRVDLSISGALDHKTMRALLEELLDEARELSHGRMLYRIDELKLPTFRALLVELELLPRLFALVNAFDRIALVADAGWVRTAGELKGKLFPGLDIKAFEPSQLEQAEDWLAR
jgi:hypothetical protein